MSFEHVTVIRVFFIPGKEKYFVGRLGLKDRQLFFEYSAEFLKTGFGLSPFKLPLMPGVHTHDDRVFDGLFGVFNDSLPDGWGRLLLDRKLKTLGAH